MLFVWTFTEDVLKRKERNNRWAEAWHLTKNTSHTHTHKSYNRLNVEWTKQQQQSVVVARSNIWSAAQDCSPTVATTNTNSKKQSPTVSVYPLCYATWTVEMLLKTCNFRFRHVYCGHCAILSTLYNGYSAILSTVNGYSAILPTCNGHCEILSTDTAQQCPQWILSNTIDIIDTAQYFPHYTMDTAQYCPQ